MFDSIQPPEEPKQSKYARPIIGMAISVCVFVLSFMLGITHLCGPGEGYNSGPSQPNSLLVLALWLLGLSFLTGVFYFLWLLVLLFRKDSR